MKRRTFLIALPLLMAAGALWFFRGPSPERPFLLYDGERGREQLRVWFDEDRGTGHGLRTAGEGESVPAGRYAFDIRTVIPAADTLWDPLAVPSAGAAAGAEAFADYRETVERGADGKIRRAVSCGRDPESAQIVFLVEVSCDYREDGSLQRVAYRHNPWIFGTTGSPALLHYDQLERLVFAECYITHGRLEYYYGYKDRERQPFCRLCLDYCMGQYTAELCLG